MTRPLSVTHESKPFFWYALASLCLLAAIIFSSTAFAQVQVTLRGSGHANKFPVTVAAFAGNGGQQAADIIAADLTRSGQFDVNRAPVMTDANGNPNWSALRNLKGMSTVVVGAVNGSTISYQLADLASQKAIDHQSFSTNKPRLLAHRVADAVYQKMTGVRGTFSTKIAYTVGKQLYVADADGANAQVVLNASAAIISPAWSPDGTRLAYTSFESGKPVVYIQNLASGTRRIVANFKGNNSAPAWSPDGSKLAVALSMNSLSNIYLISANGGSPTQISNSHEIDTEPFFFPNNSGIVFTSDRGGSPQIYRSGFGGAASRITFQGSQNLSPVISPDGFKLAYSSLRGGSYVIAAQTLGSGSDKALTNGPNDLYPSFSANGMQILYVSNGKLAIVNADGSYQSSIPSVGNVSSAAWGPFTQY